MTPTREDLELYVSGNYDGDVAALERAIAEDPSLAAMLAREAELEMLLRAAAAEATFCPACDELVRSERCDACGAAIRPGGYVVERVLVSNAHGRMYVAHDADGKQVALKELAFLHAPSAETIAAFEREAKFLRALEHPAIPRFVASFEEGQGVHTRYYLAQELVVGTALDKLDDHWYSESEIIEIARQVLSILTYLQSLSPMVIHRDIKPANLLKRADGSIALVDFGAAYAHGTTAGVTTVGTFGYMPVEQLAGIVDATTDLYALGASLLYLLTRQEPWRLTQTKTTANVSQPLRAFLDKLVAADPRDRFASAKVALAALDSRDELVPRKRRSASRGARIALMAVAGTALVAAGAGVHHLATDTADEAPSAGRSPWVSSGVEGGFVMPSRVATLVVSLPDDLESELLIDNMPLIPNVRDGHSIKLPAGKYHVKIEGACEHTVYLEPDKTTTIECVAAPAKETRLDVDKPIKLASKDTDVHTALQQVAAQCGINFVVPEYVKAAVTVVLDNIACKDAIEVILESHGLWYTYRADSKLLRVAPRKEIDADTEAAFERGRLARPAMDELPLGKTLDVDFKNASLRDVLKMLLTAGGGLNFTLPGDITGGLTIRLKGVAWRHALEAVLASHGLWYRYRKDSNVVRIAPRKQLDAEDEADFERSRLPSASKDDAKKHCDPFTSMHGCRP